MTPTDTVRQLARGGIALAHRPLAVAAYAAGLVKGTVEGTVRATGSVVDTLVHAQRRPPAAETFTASAHPTADTAPDAEATAELPAEPVVGERTLFGGLNTEAAPPMAPGGGGEPIEHEPHAESRDVAHGAAAAQPREVDSWAEEAIDTEVETPLGTTGADLGFNPDAAEDDLDQPGAEPLLDEAVAKAVRSESETLRKAADPDKG